MTTAHLARKGHPVFSVSGPLIKEYAVPRSYLNQDIIITQLIVVVNMQFYNLPVYQLSNSFPEAPNRMIWVCICF